MKLTMTWKGGGSTPKWWRLSKSSFTCRHSRALPNVPALLLAGGSAFGAGNLGFQFRDIEHDDLAAFQADDAAVHKTPQVARNQVPHGADFRANFLIGFLQGKLDTAPRAHAQLQ